MYMIDVFMLSFTALPPRAKGSDILASKRGEALSNVSIANVATVSIVINSMVSPAVVSRLVLVVPLPTHAPKIRSENNIIAVAHFFIFILFIVIEYLWFIVLFVCEDSYFITIRFKKGFPILDDWQKNSKN